MFYYCEKKKSLLSSLFFLGVESRECLNLSTAGKGDARPPRTESGRDKKRERGGGKAHHFGISLRLLFCLFRGSGGGICLGNHLQFSNNLYYKTILSRLVIRPVLCNAICEKQPILSPSTAILSPEFCLLPPLPTFLQQKFFSHPPFGRLGQAGEEEEEE